MNIIESILTKNPCYTAGQKIKVQGLMLHSVGVPQPSAAVFVKNWNRASYDSACVHAFIDGDTGKVFQTLPWDHRGWHAGGSANNTHVGVEMCEPGTIRYTGGANWVETGDGRNTAAVVDRTYKAAVELFAHLCQLFGLDPQADGVILSHSEGARRGIASGHADVEHLWGKFGYTMDGFRDDVAAAMTGQTDDLDKLYRVQAGAYHDKAKAAAQRDKLKAAGFPVYMVLANGWYKLQVGAFREKSRAEALLAKVQEFGLTAFITTESGKAVTESAAYTLEQFIRDVQRATGATVDGVAGPETLRKTVTLSAEVNYMHAAVKPVQKRLAALGFTQVGEADGVAGVKFTKAVEAFQRANSCVADGEITAKAKTWRKLLGMA